MTSVYSFCTERLGLRTAGEVRGEIVCLRERAQSPLLAYEESDLKSQTRAGNFTLSQSVLSGAIQSQIEGQVT